MTNMERATWTTATRPHNRKHKINFADLNFGSSQFTMESSRLDENKLQATETVSSNFRPFNMHNKKKTYKNTQYIVILYSTTFPRLLVCPTDNFEWLIPCLPISQHVMRTYTILWNDRHMGWLYNYYIGFLLGLLVNIIMIIAQRDYTKSQLSHWYIEISNKQRWFGS